MVKLKGSLIYATENLNYEYCTSVWQANLQTGKIITSWHGFIIAGKILTLSKLIGLTLGGWISWSIPRDGWMLREWLYSIHPFPNTSLVLVELGYIMEAHLMNERAVGNVVDLRKDFVPLSWRRNNFLLWFSVSSDLLCLGSIERLCPEESGLVWFLEEGENNPFVLFSAFSALACHYSLPAHHCLPILSWGISWVFTFFVFYSSIDHIFWACAMLNICVQCFT